MSRGRLGHQLFGADLVKGDFKQRVTAHFHHGQHHAPAESSMLDHIALADLQEGRRRRCRSKDRAFAALDLLTDKGFLRKAAPAKGILPIRRFLFPGQITALADNAQLENDITQNSMNTIWKELENDTW